MGRAAANSARAQAVFFKACSSFEPADWEADRDLLDSLTADDWSLVARWAEHHGLAGRVLRGLAGAPVDPAATSRLEIVRDVRLDLQLRRRPAVVTAIRALEAAGLQPIVLKGYVLAEEVYGSLSDRAFGDCDLLVRASAFDPARQVLAGLGYRSKQAEPNRADEHGIDLSRDDGSRIDLHWGLADEFRDLEEEQVWTTAVRPAGGGRLGGLRLSPEFTLLHLAAHLAHHDFRSVKPWVDFYVSAYRLADQIDPDRLRTLAVRYGVDGLLDLTVVMCGRHFRVRPEIRRLLAGRTSLRTRWAARTLEPALLLPARETPIQIWLASGRRRLLTGTPKDVAAWMKLWLFPDRAALAAKFQNPFRWSFYLRYYGLQMARVFGRSSKLFKDHL